MQKNNIFEPNSPDTMDIDNVPSLHDNNKSLHQQVIVNKPSNFSIEHILNNAGSQREKYILDCGKKEKNEMKPLYTDNRAECFIMDNNVVQQYPPILNWLQYTRYKPPRLPSKCEVFQKFYRINQRQKNVLINHKLNVVIIFKHISQS